MPSLPKQSVDQIFARLLVRYGATWIRMWDDIDMEAVKADWAEVLGHCSREQIRHALEHLPDGRPPNAMQFRELCALLPSSTPNMDEVLRLDVKPNPERVKRELARLKTWRAGMEKGMRETPPATAEEYRRTEGFSGPFTPPPEHTLPPGMRKDAS